ncbi:arsenate reductase ArsC [Pseudoruegeria sp. HB172150]|uniref:arsenate reductase ArsC n=1 Tax=Pseudoruegeria sp. HB172150 TaxID=2721164 RepID=UPI0015568D97|nr:arsenate reductase ArsC [Pseudoruegeria sp. HB172150]
MNILVLCTGNSARSILLESLLNDLGQGRVTAYSAGSKPAGQVHPGALSLLQQQEHPATGLRSKSWDEFAEPGAPEMDAVITVCGNAANETCPYWPGAPVRGHWGVEDPAAATPDEQPQAFSDAYATLRRRAESFLDHPVETMDPGELKALIGRVGKVA